MPQRKTKYDYGIKDIDQRPGESNIDYYMRLAKRADIQMTRVEKLSKEKGFEAVQGYAYAKAKRELAAFGWKHFERKPPEDQKIFRERLSAVKEFLSAPTAYKSGITNVYENKAKALNEKYGTSFNWQDMADFFNKGTFDKLSQSFGSKTVLRTIGTIQNARKVLGEASGNLNITSMDKENALKALRKTSAMNKLGIDKEERAKLRELIKNSGEWLTVEDESDLPF